MAQLASDLLLGMFALLAELRCKAWFSIYHVSWWESHGALFLVEGSQPLTQTSKLISELTRAQLSRLPAPVSLHPSTLQDSVAFTICLLISYTIHLKMFAVQSSSILHWWSSSMTKQSSPESVSAETHPDLQTRTKCHAVFAQLSFPFRRCGLRLSEGKIIAGMI